jgi:predicted transcriptional regulator
MKYTLQQVMEGHERLRKCCTNREEFQEGWTKLLLEAGWTREEFHQALHQYNTNLK